MITCVSGDCDVRATVSTQDARKYSGMWLSIVGNLFVHKKPIRACHAEHADRSLVSQEFESVYHQAQVHSAFCQTRSLETRL